MSNPKFSVGEIVILQSKSLPDYNGEHVVKFIVTKNTSYTCRVSGITFQQPEYDTSISYVLEEVMPSIYDGEDHDIQGIMVETNWDESSLRKKHIPGTMSFTDLMSSLNIKEKV